jgi:hypothetical protein
MDLILSEIKKGCITIGRVKCKIKNPSHKGLTDAPMKKDNSHVIYENDKRFLHVGYAMIDEESRKSILDIPRDHGYRPNDFGFDDLRN